MSHPARISLTMALLAVAGCATHPRQQAEANAAATGINWASAAEVDVALTDFDFTPSHPVFQAGQATRLVLTNSGSGRHDFSAPAFFATAAYRPGGAVPTDGKVVVDRNQKAEIDLVPGAPGVYPLDCTEFLHTIFGMTGTITVTAP